MEEIKNDNPSPSKKPFIFYAVISLVVIMLLNALVFPSMLKRSVIEVGYDKFLEMIDNDEVKEVSYDETSGQFIFIGESDKYPAIYKTGIWPDDGERLLHQLMEHPDIEFRAEIPTQASPLLSFILTWILPILFFFFIGEIFYHWMGKKMRNQLPGGNAMSFGKSGAKIYVSDSKTGVKFSDVAGQDEAKESLIEVVDFLHSPEKYTSVGAKLPKGVLLVGPPGTGKTLLAKAVAGEAQVPFFSISGSEFVEMFVGMGAAKVRDLFKQANEKASCIVFIDEIDAIGQKRNTMGTGSNDEREQTLNQLLAEMDGFDGQKGVVILAATNRPESLDPALLRPGRFDRRIPVELPDLAGRKAILKVHAKKIPVADNVDWDVLARAMITRYGMTDEFDMVALETTQNQYLGGDTSLACAADTASKIDERVIETVKNAHDKALKILRENEEQLHKLSAYLLKKETITGKEFMDLLENKEVSSDTF